MNKGKLQLSNKASPSKQTTLSKYFGGGGPAKKPEDEEPPKKVEKKEEKKEPPKKEPARKRKDRNEDEDANDNKKKTKKKKADDDDEDDFMPDAAMESEHEEEEEEYNDSPVKQKAASKHKSNGKAPAKKQDDSDDALSSQSSHSSSQDSFSSTPVSSTSAKKVKTDDGDVLNVEFKENLKLRAAFQKKLNKILDAKDASKATPDTSSKVDVAALAAAVAAPAGKGKKKSNLTPLEQQYVAIKNEYHADIEYVRTNLIWLRYPDTVLLVECGYKHKFFGEDALVANKVLKMVAYPKNNFLNASIPSQRVNFHVRRLLHAGYKVGIVKQTETAAVKKAGDSKTGPFARALSELYTPATFIDDDLANTDSDEPVTANYLMCLVETSVGTANVDKVQMSFVAVSLGTGDVIYDEFEDDFMRGGLETRLLHLQPAELILPSTLLTERTDKILRNYAANRGLRIETLEDEKYLYDIASFVVSDFYENQKKEDDDDDDDSPLAFVLKLPRNVLACIGALIEHLKDFQKLNQVFCLTGNFKSFSTANHMLLNGTTLSNLEILVNNATNEEKGSLFSIMKNTSTPFGKRLLKKWVTQPLIDISKIKERQDAVEEVATGGGNASVASLYALLKALPDLERIICRIHYKKCTPAEFTNALYCFKKIAQAIPQLKHLQSPLLKTLVSSFPAIEQPVLYFLDSLSISAANEGNYQDLFVDPSQFPDLAEGKKKISGVVEQLLSHLKDIRRTLGKANLQYSHMQKMNLEYYVELPNAQAKSVPKDWIKVGFTKEVSRFHTPFIVEKLQQLALHRENLAVVCKESWLAFLDEFAGKYVDFREAVQRLAIMDCICSLATLAKNPTYTRPVFTEKQQLVIEDGRHPVVESMMADHYVPNSTSMTEDGEKCMIITGPNMGGKSSFIRQIALIIIMAQIGSFVPATSVTLSPFDAVHTRMGAQDNLEKGQSTFFVELQEASSILKQATPRSLVILDELGRGTSTHDGVAIAYATLQYLVERLGCFSLFVTHYPLLAELENKYSSSVSNYHMAFLEEKDDNDDTAPPSVTFLYKVTKGAAKNSYGLNVARIAGIPTSILVEAGQQSDELKATITQRAFRKAEEGANPQAITKKIARALQKPDVDVGFGMLVELQETAKKALQKL